jgi:putative DNA primase/helicase
LYQYTEHPTPGRFPLCPENTPAPLRQRNQWMGTRFEEREDGNLNKPPYCIRTGRKADKTNPASWGPFKEANAALEAGRFDAIGFVFTEGDSFGCVDLDHCRSATGEIENWALKIVEELPTYWEVSVSAAGLHAIFEGTKPQGRCRRGPIELYDRCRFLVLTGKHLEDTPTDIRPCQENVNRLYRKVFGEENRTQDSIQTPSHPGSALGDCELCDRIMQSKHAAKFGRLWAGDTSGYESHSNADLALCGILAFWTGGDAAQIARLFTQSGLCRPKWTGRSDYRERTIRKALEGKTEFYTPPATLRRKKPKVFAIRTEVIRRG